MDMEMGMEMEIGMAMVPVARQQHPTQVGRRALGGRDCSPHPAVSSKLPFCIEQDMMLFYIGEARRSGRR
jgi:hypothetical protein